MALSTTIIGENAGTITKGQRALSAIGSTRKRFQVLENVFENISKDVTPLTFLLNRTGAAKRTVGQATFNHLETDRLPMAVQLDSSTYNSGVTTLNVLAGHGVRLVVGHVLKNLRTGTQMRVLTVSTDQITVTRPYAGTTDANTVASEELEIIGFADTEGNTAQSGQSSEPAFKQNAVQTFRQAIDATGRDMQSDNYGPDEWERMKKDASDAIDMQMEKAFMFGNGISTSDPTATAGLEYWITTNLFNQAAAAMSEQSWNDYCMAFSRRNQGGGKKICLAGENMRRAVDSYGRDVIRYDPRDTVLGISAYSYQNSFIKLDMISHGLLSPLGTGNTVTNGSWAGYAFLLNLDKIGLAEFKNRGKMYRDHIETPGTDGQKAEYLADVGLYLVSEKNHAIIKGIP